MKIIKNILKTIFCLMLIVGLTGCEEVKQTPKNKPQYIPIYNPNTRTFLPMVRPMNIIRGF